MQAKAYQRALLDLAALITKTPAFLAGVFVQDRHEFRDAVEKPDLDKNEMRGPEPVSEK